MLNKMIIAGIVLVGAFWLSHQFYYTSGNYICHDCLSRKNIFQQVYIFEHFSPVKETIKDSYFLHHYTSKGHIHKWSFKQET